MGKGKHNYNIVAREETSGQKVNGSSSGDGLPDGVELNRARDPRILLEINNINIAATSGEALLTNASLKLLVNNNYMLFGPKEHCQTFLRYISDASLKIRPGIDVLLCDKEVEADDTPALQAVLKGDGKWLKKVARMLEMNQSNLCSILVGLGFTEEIKKTATKNLSAAWRMRLSLARALYLKPNLIMLDEPTNYLDVNAVIWLSHYLQNVIGPTLLIISNDQCFLEKACNHIILVHRNKLSLHYHSAENINVFRKNLFQDTIKDYTKQEEMLREMMPNRWLTGKAEIKFIEELYETELIQNPKDFIIKFRFPVPALKSEPILSLHDCQFGYDPEKPLFKKCDFSIERESRVAIVGPSGVGKSTFLKLLVGELRPQQGELLKDHQLKIGRFDQHSGDRLTAEESPAKYLMRLFNLQRMKAHKVLRTFGLPSHAHKTKNKNLSGGEKAKVALAELCLSAPDVLVLDEPTNNLDIETIDALAEAINYYKRGVVIVSNDEHLIRETKCRLWVIEDQTINKIGEFDNYREKLLRYKNSVLGRV